MYGSDSGRLSSYLLRNRPRVSRRGFEQVNEPRYVPSQASCAAEQSETFDAVPADNGAVEHAHTQMDVY